MKKLLSLILLSIQISFAQPNISDSLYNKDEIIFVVQMESNEGKSIEEIAEFSKLLENIISFNFDLG